MQEYHWAQDKIDEVTQTTAERRHDWQAKAAERRLKQMAAKREKEAKRAAANAPKKAETYHCGDPYCGDCPEPHNERNSGAAEGGPAEMEG